MKNKRQAAIKAFFIQEFGEQKGITFFENKTQFFNLLLNKQKEKAKVK